MGVRYTHKAITTEHQIDILKGRGLLIDDVEHAIEVLNTISYFRLAGYWRHLEIDRFTHQFREGSRFADVIDLYFFDQQLRALLFTAIQTIEVSVRTKIIKHFAPEFGAFWFMDENYATNEARFATNLAVIRKEVSRSNDDFITEHFRKQTLYPQLCYVTYWLNSITTNNTFVADFKRLLVEHPSVNPHSLGYPRNWEQEPLWR